MTWAVTINYSQHPDLGADQEAYEVDEKGDIANRNPIDLSTLVGWTITDAKKDDCGNVILSLHRPS